MRAPVLPSRTRWEVCPPAPPVLRTTPHGVSTALTYPVLPLLQTGNLGRDLDVGIKQNIVCTNLLILLTHKALG